MRPVVIFAAVALVAAVYVPRYLSHIGAAPAPAVLEAHPAASAAARGADHRSLVVARNGRGHFEVDGRVNGRGMGFVVDTGASVVALTAHDAARLGMHPMPNAFSVQIRTANGTVLAAPARLDVVEVGDLELHDVAAVVMPDEALRDNLLGLSFLSRLRRFEYAGGQLVLEQ